jgi:hypothetical protein
MGAGRAWRGGRGLGAELGRGTLSPPVSTKSTLDPVPSGAVHCSPGGNRRVQWAEPLLSISRCSSGCIRLSRSQVRISRLTASQDAQLDASGSHPFALLRLLRVLHPRLRWRPSCDSLYRLYGNEQSWLGLAQTMVQIACIMLMRRSSTPAQFHHPANVPSPTVPFPVIPCRETD